MPELCARVSDETVCMPVDLAVFEDPRPGDVRERPGDAPGEVETVDGGARVRTRVARGTVPDAWPRDEPVAGELVKGRERVPCELVVRSAGDGASDGGVELVLVGEEVFRAVMGRAP